MLPLWDIWASLWSRFLSQRLRCFSTCCQLEEQNKDHRNVTSLWVRFRLLSNQYHFNSCVLYIHVFNAYTFLATTSYITTLLCYYYFILFPKRKDFSNWASYSHGHIFVSALIARLDVLAFTRTNAIREFKCSVFTTQLTSCRWLTGTFGWILNRHFLSTVSFIIPCICCSSL